MRSYRVTQTLGLMLLIQAAGQLHPLEGFDLRPKWNQPGDDGSRFSRSRVVMLPPIHQLDAPSNGEMAVQKHAEAEPIQLKGTGVELSGAWYFPLGQDVEDIYGGFARWMLEVTLPAPRGFAGWLGIGSMQVNGYSLCDGDCTRLNLIPAIVGVKKYTQWKEVLRPYLALGALSTWVVTQNYSPYVMQTAMDWSLGGIARVGIEYEEIGIRLALFADYSYLRANLVPACHCDQICTNSADLSGIAVGLTVGYSF